jgi:putative restriction endonuclease
MELVNNLLNKALSAGVRFFILDTKGVGHKYDDEDFKKYSWSPKQYNRVRPGDLFIYRRPNAKTQKESFYFFGAGIIGPIQKIDENIVQATILSPLIFNSYLLPIELINFTWGFKQKTRDDWQYFFNQYGMMEVAQNDFIGLLKLQYSYKPQVENVYEEIDHQLEVNFYLQMHRQNFRVEDKVMTQKVRGSAQAIFAKEVKGNYHHKCCITGIDTKELLIASHIVPWSKDENNRLNPANGLCFSPLFDKAFDLGFMTVRTDYRIEIAEVIKKDKVLSDYFSNFHGNRIIHKVRIPPDLSLLDWHNKKVFKGLIKL